MSVTRLRAIPCVVICLAALLAAGCGAKGPAEAEPAPTPEPQKPTATVEGDAAKDKPPEEESEPTTTAPKATGDPMIVDAVYAVVDKQVLTVGEIARKVEPIVRGMLRGREPPGEEELKALRELVFGEVAHGLIAKALILKAAREKGLVVDEARVGSQINRILLKEELSLDEYLERSKLTYQQLYKEVHDDVLFSAFRQMEIVPRVNVTPGEIRAYFEKHKADFSTPEQVHCHQIILFGHDEERQQTAQEALDKLRAGAEFAEIAKEYSKSSTAPKGGDFGWVARDVINSEKVNRVLFDQLKIGEISGVIEDEKGFLWIVTISGRREARQALLKDAWGDIERRLRRTKIEKETLEYARRIGKTTSITPERVRDRFLKPPEERPH